MKQQPTFKTIKYGELVEYHGNGGYHAGVKVHFFNHKGVLIGNFYKLVPYSDLKLPYNRGWERVAYGRSFEKLRQFVYETFCKAATIFIRTTQNWSK